MEIKLIEFGKNGYPITDKTLSLLEELSEKEQLPICAIRPFKTRHTLPETFMREFTTFKPSDVAGLVTDIEYDFSLDGLVLYGRIKPEGPKKAFLEAALRIHSKDLSLIPRAMVKPHENQFQLEELLGFDLFLEMQQVHDLLTKHNVNVEN